MSGRLVPAGLDQRPEWADPAAFPDGTQVLAEEPLQALDQLPFGPDAHVVLVSHSHAVDQAILGARRDSQARTG